MDQRWLEDELSELRAEVTALRARVDRLEGSAPVRSPADGPATGAATDGGPPKATGWFAATFTGLAVICFTLVGALVLRVATQQGWLGPGLGVGLGLSYCGLLLIGPAILRRAAFMVAYGGAMQACAVLLAPSIVLETFHRQGLVRAEEAAVVLIAFGLVGGAIGGLLDRRAAAWLGLLGGMLGLGGLGLVLDAGGLRAFGLLGLLATGLIVAHARGWSALRSLVLLAAGSFLGVAVLATAHREGVAGSTAAWILAAAGAAWLLVAINHQARSARLDEGEAAWLPLGTLWIAGLGVFHSGARGATVSLGVGLMLLAAAWWRGRDRSATGPAVVGLGAAGGLAAALGAGLLDPSGLGLAGVALACLGLAAAARSDLLAVAAQLVAIGGVARFMISAKPFDPAWPGAWVWPAAVALAGLLVVHARLAQGRSRTAAGAFLAPVSLAGALAVCYGAASAGLLAALGPGDAARFGTSGLLAAAAGACLWLGTASQGWRGLFGLGLAGVFMLAVKVLLFDLFSMGGAPLLGSFVALGVAFGLTSLALRRRSAASAGSGPGGEDDPDARPDA